MWVKICGVTDPANAKAVAATPGVSAVGLNFFAKSPRFISRKQAVEVRRAVGRTAVPVGLFVNESVTTIRYVCERLQIDTVQLHGSEPAETVRDLSPLRVIRVIRVPNGRIAEAVGLTLDSVGDAENLEAILLDAASETALGGTGRRLDWDELARCERATWPRMILAGGLRPENVAEAVATVRPDGVDAASGVESTVGVKAIDAVRRFAAAASG